ncbi:hypothetical protein [Nocardiopsis sp. LOL_012]|uniref:hypothetical protein n=1 Tax=Nocardiopsis sp. LOL_012 TaxID=3345409 RepID=UPI003A864A1E
MLASLSDRLLARIVPKARAGAVGTTTNCWYTDCSRTHIQRCCYTTTILPGSRIPYSFMYCMPCRSR